ncbi:MAG TPA: class I SAM-dependent methyltransferase, partial [Vicinamibacteria bacterium]|nr:class I SAM-dependent methyltransferase [Vicinamibacteria bacterium]
MSVGCRSCGGGVEVLLTLGRVPLANALLRPEEVDRPEPVFPLDVALCGSCALLQLVETVPPEELFSEYLYFSSFSTTMVEHARRLCSRLVAERGLGRGSLAVEVGSNDGYLLRWYAEAGIPVLGIEPARNVAQVARDRGIPTECVFFGREEAERLARQGHRADLIHAHNVMAHVADLNGFVAGLRGLLKPGGLALIEVPYLKDLLDHLEFDTIYHEHLCYFSLTALVPLFERHALVLEDVERVPIHGGSLRVFVAPAGSVRPGREVSSLLEEERGWGVGRPECYRDFARRIDALKADLTTLLKGLKAQGRRVAAYGASAKGSTLLNVLGIGRETLEFVADRSTYKQGRLMPGAHIPIVPPERLAESMPDYVLLLTWNFA